MAEPYTQARNTLRVFTDRFKLTNCPQSNTGKGENTVIIALKAGGKDYSETQFDIEEAISITSQAIKQMNQLAPNSYQFVIDGITSPYTTEKYNNPIDEEPEQRKKFIEREAYWFLKLKEELPEIQLTFINGI